MTTSLLIGWNAGLWLYLVLVGVMITTATRDSMMRSAEQQDEGRFTILFFATLAVMRRFRRDLRRIDDRRRTQKGDEGLHIGLAAATIVSAWAFIHVMFALHYAHEFLPDAPRTATPRRPSPRRSDFPGTSEPDYLDFFYFSFVIGVACATADVEIWSRGIRRTALVHCVLAFFFNSAVLALTINIAAGLV